MGKIDQTQLSIIKKVDSWLPWMVVMVGTIYVIVYLRIELYRRKSYRKVIVKDP